MTCKRLWLLAMGLLVCLAVTVPAVAQQDEEEPEDRWEEEPDERERWEDEPGERERGEDEEAWERRRHRRDEWVPTDEDIADALAFLKEFDVWRYREATHLQRRAPEHFRMWIRETIEQMRWMEELKTENPAEYERVVKMRKLEVQCFELAERYRKSRDDTEKTSFRDQLKTVLNQLFDLRETEKEREIAMLEKELEDLRATVAKRKQNKSVIVQNRLKDLLGERDDMEW